MKQMPNMLIRGCDMNAFADMFAAFRYSGLAYSLTETTEYTIYVEIPN